MPASMSVDSLYSAPALPACPVIVDLRSDAEYSATPRLIPGARRRDPNQIDRWAQALSASRALAVYDADGRQSSQATARALAAFGYRVSYVECGIAAWLQTGCSTVKARPDLNAPGASRWVTRERPKIDRLACPWLIRRFIDPEALFFYAPAARVRPEAQALGAQPYDIADVTFSHRGPNCSFDAFLAEFDLHDERPARMPRHAGVELVIRPLSERRGGHCAFFGLKAAVLAVVVEAAMRIGQRALKTRFMVALAGAAFAAIYLLHVPFPWIILGAAAMGAFTHRLNPSLLPAQPGNGATRDHDSVIDRMFAAGLLAHARPSVSRAALFLSVCLALWFLPIALAALWLGSRHAITREGLFFSQTAIVTFGGAYAVLAYVAQHTVQQLHWLHPGEMLDGLALAETTPGPLIMVLQFVGFLAAYRYPGDLDPWIAAGLGAMMTTWVAFLPSFLFIFVGAPYIEALRRHELLTAALSAITAAVVGVILNLSLWFAMHTVFEHVNERRYGPVHLEVPDLSSMEPGALALSAAAMIAMLRAGKLSISGAHQYDLQAP